MSGFSRTTRPARFVAAVPANEEKSGEFSPGACDSALVGFFASHLTEAQEEFFFAALSSLLAPEGRFLILDSAWTAERARFNQKDGRQHRRRIRQLRTIDAVSDG